MSPTAGEDQFWVRARFRIDNDADLWVPRQRRRRSSPLWTVPPGQAPPEPPWHLKVKLAVYEISVNQHLVSLLIDSADGGGGRRGVTRI